MASRREETKSTGYAHTMFSTGKDETHIKDLRAGGGCKDKAWGFRKEREAVLKGELRVIVSWWLSTIMQDGARCPRGSEGAAGCRTTSVIQRTDI